MKKSVLFILFFIALLLLPQLMRYTQELSQRFRVHLNTYLEEKTSFKISYETFSFRLLNKLVLHNVQLRNDSAFVQISQLQIGYQLTALFNDKKNFWQLITVKNATIDVQFLDDGGKTKNYSSFFKKFNLEFLVENSQVHWKNSNNNLNIIIDYFDFNHALKNATVNFQGTVNLENQQPFTAQSKLEVKGILQENRADFWLETQNAQLNRFKLQNMELFLQIDEKQILLSDLHSENNINLDLSYIYENRDFHFEANFQDLILSDFQKDISFQQFTELENQLFGGKLIISQTANTPLSYSFDILGVFPHTPQEGLPWSIKTRGQGDLQNIVFEELEVQADPGLELAFSGSVALETLLPQGIFRFAWGRVNMPYLGGTLQLEKQSNSIQIVSEDFSVEQDQDFALIAEMQRDSKNSLAVKLQAYYQNDDLIDLSMRVQLVPEINVLLELSFPEEGFSVEKFAHFLPPSWQEFFAGSIIMGDTTWLIDRQNLDVKWPNFLLKKNENSFLSASLNWHSGQFEAENIKLEVPDNPSGFNRLFAGNLRGTLQQGELNGVLLGQNIENRWNYESQKFYINGDHNLIEISTQSVKISLDNFLLPYQGSFVARLQGDFAFDMGEQWELNFQNIELETLLKNRFSPQKIIAAGKLQPQNLVLEKLQWWQFDTFYTGELSFKGNFFDYNLNLELQAPIEQENVELRLEYRDDEGYSGHSSFQINLPKIFNNDQYQGFLHSNLQFNWQNELFIRGETQLIDGLIKQRQSDFQTSWFYRNGDLLLRNFKGRYDRIQLNRATLLFNEQQQKLVANASYQSTFGGEKLSSAVNLDLNFIEPVSLLQLKQGFNRIRGQLDVAQITLKEKKLLPALRFIFEKNAANLNIYEIFHDALRFEAEEGVLDLLIQQPFPFEATLKGFYRHEQLSADLKILSPSILFANNFIPKIYNQRVATITQGQASAELKVEGPLLAPSLLGDIKIDDFLFNSPYLPEKAKTTQLNFGVKNHVVLLKPSQLQFERGQLNFPGYEKNYFVFKNLVLERYFFEVKTGNLGIPLSYNREQITSEGTILGRVILKKRNEEQFIDGNITFRNLFVTLETQEKKRVPYTPPPPHNSSDFNINLQITTGKNFIFERRPFLYAQGQVNDTLKISFNGEDNTGSIKGKLNFPSAELNLGYSSQGRGEVILDETLPQFNPLLSFSSFEQVYQGGTPIAITLTYQGLLEDILDEKNFPEITSDPEIPENEARVLLLSKQTSFNENAWLLLPNFALQAGEDSLLRGLSIFLERNISFIDLLSIQTRIASNILLDTQLLTPTSSPEKRFLRYLDKSSITLSKYINHNNTVLLSAGFSMEYNLEMLDTDFNFNGLQIVPELGLTFITPLVTIGMEFGLNNTQQLFIPGSSIEVSLGLEL